jgi:hypothetical protein
LLASDIQQFLTSPREPASLIIGAPSAPPGAPIGDLPYDWLLGDPGCWYR